MIGRRLIDIALVAVLLASGIAVWAGQQRTPDPFLRDITSAGVLRVGIDPTYPPFDTMENGQVSGYDAALVRAIAADLGVRPVFVPLALDTMYDALAAGKVDLLVSALPLAYERQKDVRYSQPYYQAGQVLVVPEGSTSISDVRDLAGKKVGVELGSEADTEARRLARTYVTMKLMSVYHSPEEALAAVARGDEDAAITDNTSAEAYARTHPGSLSILSPGVTDDPYVVAMPVRASGLADSVNATIDRLRASGRLAAMMGLAGK